jgi:predicted CopG family antitoxin
MKKLKFDALFESLMMSEGTISKQQRYGNIQYDIASILNKIGDEESDSYSEIINPFIERWKGQKYLGNLSSDDIVSILDEVITNLNEMNDDGIPSISYNDFNSIIENITNERFKGYGQGMSVLAKRWSSKIQTFFEKIKDAHISEISDDNSSDDEFGDSEENMTSSHGIKSSVLEVIQASDSMSKEEILNFLVRRMGKDEKVAENIIDSLISSNEIVENDSGKYEINRETKQIETLGSVDDDDDLDIETHIPFKEDDLTGEDEDVDAAFRDALESDPYKSSDY